MESTAEQRAPLRDLGMGANVGQRIREIRKKRGMSLAQLGGTDLSRSFLSLVELGRSRISLRALALVANRPDMPISYFLDEEVVASGGASELNLDYAQTAVAR